MVKSSIIDSLIVSYEPRLGTQEPSLIYLAHLNTLPTNLGCKCEGLNLSPSCLMNKSLTIEPLFELMIFFCHHILLCTFFYHMLLLAILIYSMISYSTLFHHRLLFVIIGYLPYISFGYSIISYYWQILICSMINYSTLFHHRLLFVIIGYLPHISFGYSIISYYWLFYRRLLLDILSYVFIGYSIVGYS